MKQLVAVIALMPFIGHARNIRILTTNAGGHEIHFEQAGNWEQILDEAKMENKYIFVDCYTTWCGPCMEMEKSVYADEKVADFFNDKFISVKMQMDTSKEDNDNIKRRYVYARYFQTHYKINTFPTFLFFNPKGLIINRDIGAKTVDDFLALGRESANPAKDYYELLEQFRHGKRDFAEMSYMAHMGLKLEDSNTAQQIAKEYIYLLKGETLFTKPSIQFMEEFTKGSEDKGFFWFYRDADSIDKIMGDDIFSEQFVQSIIYREVVVPELNQKTEAVDSIPDWNNIQSLISKRYNDYYSERVITGAKATWGFDHKNLQEYTKWLVRFQEKFGSKANTGFMASWTLNDYAWAIFLYSDNRDELNKALSWSCRAVMMSPSANWMDTYANILFKLGRTNEAIAWERIAAKLSPKNQGIEKTLNRMEKELLSGKAP
jgi:thioredoxin-related protein